MRISDWSSDVCSSDLQPYWKTIEVRIAAAIYFAMAIFTIGLFVSIWRGLMRFRRLARSIRTGASHVSFAEQNRVPELAPVAEEFDRMTMALQDSAESIRLAADRKSPRLNSSH